MNEIKHGITCGVNTCKYNHEGCKCNLDTIVVGCACNDETCTCCKSYSDKTDFTE